MLPKNHNTLLQVTSRMRKSYHYVHAICTHRGFTLYKAHPYHRTESMCRAALAANGNAELLASLPQRFLTPDFLQWARQTQLEVNKYLDRSLYEIEEPERECYMYNLGKWYSSVLGATRRECVQEF